MRAGKPVCLLKAIDDAYFPVRHRRAARQHGCFDTVQSSAPTGTPDRCGVPPSRLGGGLQRVGGKISRRFITLPTFRQNRCLGHRQMTTSTAAPSDTAVQSLTLPADRERVSHNGDGPDFDWSKGWYPVQFVRNFDDDRPNRVELLGRWFVVWKGLSGSWNVMDDKCPHRLAPLSEGRVESDGNLLCAYHAWRFDESGKCVKIPQADSPKAECAACDSKRSRVMKYPAKVVGGMLFVWPDTSETRVADSEATPIPINKGFAAHMDESEAEGFPLGYTRLMPYSHDILVENLIDPAHIQVSHHGAAPTFSQYTASSMNMASVENEAWEHKPYAAVSVKCTAFNSIDFRLTFSPPCHIEQWIHISGVDPNPRTTLIYTVPLGPGRSRLFFIQHAGLSPTKVLLRKLFPWLDHLWYNRIFDGDNVFLNVQDRNMRAIAAAKGTDNQGGNVGASSEFFMATSSDVAVADFRKWFDTHGQGGPAFPGGKHIDYRELSKEEMLNRFEQHTKECKACQGALKLLERLKVLAWVASAGCFGGLCVMLGVYGFQEMVAKGMPAIGGVGLLVGMAIAEAVRRFAAHARQKFFFVDYCHADMD